MKKRMNVLLAATMILQFIQMPVLAEEEIVEPAVVEEETIQAEETIVMETHAGWQKDGFSDWVYYENGQLKTGWLNYKGDWYYLDANNGGKMVYNDPLFYVPEDNKAYSFDMDGKCVKNGLVEYFTAIDFTTYYYVENYKSVGGWKTINGKTYYFQYRHDYGVYISLTGIQEIDGTTYYFKRDSSCVQNGWWTFGLDHGYLKPTVGWLYIENNQPVSGWRYINGYWYYFEDKQIYEYTKPYMISNEYRPIDGKYYYFNADGQMSCNKWEKTEDGKWIYLTNSGAAASGWFKDTDGKWYYLDPNDRNQMVANERKKINGKFYRFDASGAMYENKWVNVETQFPAPGYYSNWYYYGKDGAEVVGWNTINGKLYYFRDTGYPYTGTIEYELNHALVTNQELEIIEGGKTKTYCFDENGACVKDGWFKMGGFWYYASNYKKLTAQWAGDYYLDNSGVMVTYCYVYNPSNGNYYWIGNSGKYEPNWTIKTKPNGYAIYNQTTGERI